LKTASEKRVKTEERRVFQLAQAELEDYLVLFCKSFVNHSALKIPFFGVNHDYE
jgi:hypothetical protein